MAADPRDPMLVLRKLHAQIVARRPVIQRAHAYYDGAHNLAFAGEKFLEAFGGLFRAFADNWCGVVCNAVDERLQVQGFRLPEQPKNDQTATRIWQANQLDLQSGMGHLDGLIGGAYYATVWAGPDGPTTPEVTVDSAMSTIVECHPKIRRRRTAALRTHLDDDGFEHAELWIGDDRLYLFRSRSKSERYSEPGNIAWIAEDANYVRGDVGDDGYVFQENPMGAVPVVEFLNLPRLTISRRAGWGAHSEIASVMPLQDAGNKLVADMLVASEFAAYPQRNITGYTPAEEKDPTTGKPTGKIIEPRFVGGPGKVWWLEDTEANFGQFDPADLNTHVGAIGMIVQHIAAISATPPHYLNTSADRLSGESIKSAESGLIAKVRRKQTTWGAGWEEVMRLAGRLAGSAELAAADAMEVIWKDPETRTESEHIDALSKKKDLDVPAPQLWEEMGYTDTQIARFPKLRAQMQLEGMAANAAESARLATAQAEELRRRSIAATGAPPEQQPPALPAPAA